MTTPPASAPARVRLAELLAALSLGVDLGFGQPMEHVLRQTVIALRLAERVGLSDEERSVVYYTSMVVNVACHTDAHEQAKWFGDDIDLKRTKYQYENPSVAGALDGLRRIGRGHPPLHRFRVGLEFALAGRREVANMIDQHAALARRFAEQLDLPSAVQEAVGSAYEQWDGRGWPGERGGEDVPIAARLAYVAEHVEVAHRVGGVDAAAELCEARRGAQFDPTVAALVVREGRELLGGLDLGQTWDAVISSEPALAVVVSGDAFDDALLAIADFVDLKSPYTLGHSRAVRELCAGAARHLGLGDDEARTLTRAALVQGFGRLGISNAILDKAGPLGAGEWERVRMQPYLTERMLHQSPALAPLGTVAVQLREHLDGSGYPRGLSGAAISRPARILAAADAFQSMREPRPFRSTLAEEVIVKELRADVRAGRLDADAVDAVLAAAGHRVRRRREGPAGLTPREIQVLRLLARGLSNKEIAAQLAMAPKTARNHVEHIYTKIGATSRVTASLFAVQHGLLADDEPVAP